MIQRVKDPNEFLAELERPLGTTAVTHPTEMELEADAKSFTAFMAAMGGQAHVRTAAPV